MRDPATAEAAFLTVHRSYQSLSAATSTVRSVLCDSSNRYRRERIDAEDAEVEADCRALGLTLLRVDGTRDLAALAALVEAHLAPFLR